MTPCKNCGHAFDHDTLGKYGCPNCHHEREAKAKATKCHMRDSGTKQSDKTLCGIVRRDLHSRDEVSTREARSVNCPECKAAMATS